MAGSVLVPRWFICALQQTPRRFRLRRQLLLQFVLSLHPRVASRDLRLDRLGFSSSHCQKMKILISQI